ncbi:hypothetical protein ABES25_09860 [Bacillus gobiensis]|uniref:hypothetical protein n=1 Tax=Bacillus gobiensis TaxID=1441095 RepID=UPI003D2358D0
MGNVIEFKPAPQKLSLYERDLQEMSTERLLDIIEDVKDILKLEEETDPKMYNLAKAALGILVKRI